MQGKRNPWTVSAPNLLQDEKYVNAVAKTCERLDRILSGTDAINVHVAPTAPMQGVPAYQQGGDLYLVPSEVENMVNDPTDEDEVLPTLVALDLHELGHFEFSPRPDNAIWKRDINRQATYKRDGQGGMMKDARGFPVEDQPSGWEEYHGALRIANALEDQRQELLMTTRYPRARDYFRLAVLKAMYKLHKSGRGIPPENFLLYYGRRHMLPMPLLRRLEAQMVAKYGPQAVIDAKALIDEYLRISASSGQGQDEALGRMWDISVDLWKRFKANLPQDSQAQCYQRSRIGARTSKKMQDKASKDARDLLDKIDKAQAEKDERDTDDMTDEAKAEADQKSKDRSDDDTPSQSPKPSKKDEQSDEDDETEESDETEDADLSDDEDEDDEDSDEDYGDEGDDEDDESDSGDDEGDGDGDPFESELGKSLRDYIGKAFGKLASDTGDRSEEVRMQILGGAAQRLARLLKEISTDLKETDHSRIRSGKLDIRRVPVAIARADPTIFRRRQESLESEATMGVHVMVDVSGSMQNSIAIALSAAATIAKASELAGHHVKVSTFATYPETIKEWADSELKTRNVYAGGGTSPLSLLKGALPDFRSVGKANRFRNYACIVVTDGEFDQPEECANAIRDLHRAGVAVLLVGINTPIEGWSEWDRASGQRVTHEFTADGTVTIKDVADLEKVMRVYIKRMALRIARRVLQTQ